MSITLRDYQLEAVDSIYAYFNKHDGNPILVLPGGTGKSIILAGFTARALHEYPTTRIMCLTHVKELIEQNASKLKTIWPAAPMGVYSAGLKSKQIGYQVTFGGIQSVRNNVAAFGWIDILLIDECHLVSPAESTSYQQVIGMLRMINPHMKVIGFTATDYRIGLGRITDGGIFTDIAINMGSIEWWNRFIAAGHLVPPIPFKTATAIDTSNVGIQAGDFAQAGLQRASDTTELNYRIASEMCHMGVSRRKWLTFCSGIEHAEHMAELFRSFGIPSATIHSKMPRDEVDRRIVAHKRNEIRNMCTHGMCTIGYDDPEIDFIGMLRASMSAAWWVQAVSRGTRPSPGKQNVLIGDFARNTERLGPINDPVIPRMKGEKAGDPPVRLCDACGAYNHASARVCAMCGQEFTVKNKLIAIPTGTELLRSDLPVTEWWPVMRCIYHTHKSKSNNESIRVQYICQNFKVVSEFQTFEGAPFRVHKAKQWWRQIMEMEPPSDNATALYYLQQNHARSPTKIHVWVNRQFPEILGYNFD
jgi:DNA repair protein RadD